MKSDTMLPPVVFPRELKAELKVVELCVASELTVELQK